LFHDRSADAPGATEDQRNFVCKPKVITHRSLHY
jgi:hypothetical protein